MNDVMIPAYVLVIGALALLGIVPFAAWLHGHRNSRLSKSDEALLDHVLGFQRQETQWHVPVHYTFPARLGALEKKGYITVQSEMQKTYTGPSEVLTVRPTAKGLAYKPPVSLRDKVAGWLLRDAKGIE